VKGIEAAFFGAVATEHIELKRSANGNPWCAFSVGITMGANDDGREMQWVRVACFGETAERAAATFKKGTRIYIECQLKLDHWNDAKTGEPKHGLSASAFKAERVGVSNIGRNKPPKINIDRRFAQAEPAPYVGDSRASYAGNVYVPPQHQREGPRVQGLNDEFGDEVPFGRAS
jgi:single stranded DNA-binding protein